MPKESVLIVEDDAHISQLIQYNLEKAGYEAHVASTGEEALDLLKRKMFQLALLDVMLPGMDGFEICRFMKGDARLKAIPIIMLTAKGEEVDRIVGLELGADDYVVKPFSPRELLLRIKAVLKRMQGSEAPVVKDKLKWGDILVDVPKHEVLVGKKSLDLTPIEFKLLCILIERRGRVQTRERLLADVWDVTADIDTRTVDAHVKRLREKLGKSGTKIETMRGVGYKFSDA